MTRITWRSDKGTVEEALKTHSCACPGKNQDYDNETIAEKGIRFGYYLFVWIIQVFMHPEYLCKDPKYDSFRWKTDELSFSTFEGKIFRRSLWHLKVGENWGGDKVGTVLSWSHESGIIKIIKILRFICIGQTKRAKIVK